MRVCFLVDGFNLYHSILEAEAQLKSEPLRWLDLHGLCSTLVRSTYGPGATLGVIHYFSALAKHMQLRRPDVVNRHQVYLKMLKGFGVDVHLADFQEKWHKRSLDRVTFNIRGTRKWWRLPIPWLRVRLRTYEEKETDVAIACKLLEVLQQGSHDSVLLMTGDTDLVPAVVTGKRMFPNTEVAVAFPYKRHNQHLKTVADKSIVLSLDSYQSHQLPATVPLPNGQMVTKPTIW